MKLEVLLFGVARDIFNSPTAQIELDSSSNVGTLKSLLVAQHASLKALAGFVVAVNQEYATDDLTLKEGDEVAIIPPVSGG